jgi:hypothetical protein
MKLRSKLAAGTTVCVTLPCDGGDANTPAAA